MKQPKFLLIVFALVIFGISILGLTFAFNIFPPSLQVYLAGIAGCNLSEEVLKKDDPEFKGIKFWEPPLAHLYRWKQRLIGGSFVISDSLTTNESVFHILLMASDGTKQMCDREILQMARRYHEMGAPINHFNDHGYTPLHEAVITANEKFVRTFLSLGADRYLKVRNKNSVIHNMDANEMVDLFYSKSQEKEKWKLIKEIIDNQPDDATYEEIVR